MSPFLSLPSQRHRVSGAGMERLGAIVLRHQGESRNPRYRHKILRCPCAGTIAAKTGGRKLPL